MDILSSIPRDIALIVFREIHRQQLLVCFDTIFEHLEWNETGGYYTFKHSAVRLFNYRKLNGPVYTGIYRVYIERNIYEYETRMYPRHYAYSIDK